MLALILDRVHAFVDPVLDVAASVDRPLVAVRAALPGLPAPAGSRACAGGRDFAFVVDRTAMPATAWRPIRECSEPVWQLYVELMLGGYEPPTRAVDVWSFGSGPEMTSQLAHLVTCGAKRVTMGWNAAAARSGTPIAYEGGISIVTDGFGYPRAVLRTRELEQAGEPDHRVFAIAAWRDAPFYSDAERAALALTEAVTRLADREDPVPDAIWNEAANHYDEAGLASLLLAIASINVWNRLNVPTRQLIPAR